MLRNVFLIFITLISAFGAGVWMGKNPNKLNQKLGIEKSNIKILVTDTDLLPANWQLWESKIRAKITIQAVPTLDKFSELTDTADLIFANQEWLRLSRAKGLKVEQLNILDKKISKNISVDFLTSNAQQQGWIPFWWEIKENKLVVYSWLLHKTTPEHTKKATELLELLIDKQTVLNWIDDIDLNTTFKSLDESFIPEEKKASYLRKIKFPDNVKK